MLEPYEWKRSRTVLRRERASNRPDLVDYINQERKKGLGYLAEMTVDTENGIVVGVDCFPANQRESNIILEHIKEIQNKTGINIKALALDAGYDVGAVHRGLELLGITGYVSCIDFSYDILRRNLKYMPETDCFECPAGKLFDFIKLTYKKSTQNYYRLYRMSATDRKLCLSCKHRKQCAFLHRIPELMQVLFTLHFTEIESAMKRQCIRR